jgi:transposase
LATWDADPRARAPNELRAGAGRSAPEGDIELEIEGVVVRVRRGAETKTVAAVIKALKAVR